MNVEKRDRGFWSRGAQKQRGFTLTEIIVASSIAALAFSAASLLFQAIGANNKRLSSVVSVPIGTVAATNFYGLAVSDINVYSAPNYGRSAFAEEMRELFWEDLGISSAVYCLGRDGLNSERPATIPFPAFPGQIRLDTPEAFRQHFVTQFPAAATIFTPYRVVPGTSNATVFVLGPSGSDTEIDVVAIYELDFIVTGDPAGTYASIRRYVDGNLANYYDAFYPQGTGTLFRPLFVAFERRNRLAYPEAPPTVPSWPDRFKRAKNQPFYFMWWPDPAAPALESPSPATYVASDPRAEYGHMGGRTSFMFTVPMFPSQ